MKNKSSRISLGLRVILMYILMVLFAKELYAKEIYNVKVVEYFEEVVGRTSLAYAGVDTTGDGFADIFLIIEPLESTLYRRLANYVEQTKIVSYDDSRKVYDRELGNYTVSTEYILEVGKKSVLELFPGKRVDFPIEAARQERLKREASQAPAQPQSAEERRIAELEAELQRLKQGR